jgi:hypothetical protein
MNHELKVTTTNNKSGKFHYQVIDENGTIISERKSNREYVACTIDGEFYFGRLDLIGKGNHATYIKYALGYMQMSLEKFNDAFKNPKYTQSKYEYQEFVEMYKNKYKILNTIAYKK